MYGINGQYDDRLNQIKYQDLQREIEYLHLLNEVEGVRYGPLARAGRALLERLHALRSRFLDRKASAQGMYQPTEKKISI